MAGLLEGALHRLSKPENISSLRFKKSLTSNVAYATLASSAWLVQVIGSELRVVGLVGFMVDSSQQSE